MAKFTTEYFRALSYEKTADPKTGGLYYVEFFNMEYHAARLKEILFNYNGTPRIYVWYDLYDQTERHAYPSVVLQPVIRDTSRKIF